MNVHDSAILAGEMLNEGFQNAESIPEADIVIFNTCSVRDHADHKVVSELGRLKKKFPDKEVVLAGCFAKQIKLRKETPAGRKKNKKDRQAKHYDYCFAPEESALIPSALANKTAVEGLRFDGNDWAPSAAYMGSARTAESEYPYPETSVKITEGCNNYCSYCIVPYVRGPERHVPLKDIEEAVRRFAGSGKGNILLLGQNVNSYSAPDAPGIDFCSLISRLSLIDGVNSIKFLTSHPRDFNDRLIEAVCSNRKISKEIHLPVQSGSDRILRAMNRGYDREYYVNLVNKLRKGRPDISLSTDIIVGFPGESCGDFQMTLSLIGEMDFDYIFAFKYSPRPFTKAFEIYDDVPVEEKKERLEAVFEKLKETKYL